MLIHYRCRLSAAVALKAVELLRSDGMLAENAFKGDTAAQRFRCVVAHIFHSSPASGQDLGQSVLTLRLAMRDGRILRYI